MYEKREIYYSIRNWTGIKEIPELNDDGWRYMHLHSEGEASDEQFTQPKCEDVLPVNFFIWRMDNF